MFGDNSTKRTHIYGDNFFQNIGFFIHDPLQMHYFGDNFVFYCVYVAVIID